PARSAISTSPASSSAATASSTARPRTRAWTVVSRDVVARRMCQFCRAEFEDCIVNRGATRLDSGGGRCVPYSNGETRILLFRTAMKFSATLSILFKEVPFLERFERGARAGFGAVEFWWPADPVDEVADAIESAGLYVALFNFDVGDMPSGDRGLLSDPERDG